MELWHIALAPEKEEEEASVGKDYGEWAPQRRKNDRIEMWLAFEIDNSTLHLNGAVKNIKKQRMQGVQRIPL